MVKNKCEGRSELWEYVVTVVGKEKDESVEK